MNVLIIEDEPAAARHLQALIQKLPFAVNVLAVLETIRSATDRLQTHPFPDLIISDIQLADGNSFEIFRTVPVTAPIIFTTAYDEYMQRAFKLHSIDYLLKPIDEHDLRAAFEKYSTLQSRYQRDISEQLQQLLTDEQLLQLLNTSAKPVAYKSRFLIKAGNRLATVPVEDVAVLQADNRIVTLHDKEGRKFILDDSLDDLEQVLNPMFFFRLNRKYMVPISSIDRIQNHVNGKLHIRLKNWEDREVFVSREKAKQFRRWLDGLGG